MEYQGLPSVHTLRNVALRDQSIRVVAAGDGHFRQRVAAALNASEVALVDGAETADALVMKVLGGGFDCVVVGAAVGDRNSLEVHEILEQQCKSAPPMIFLIEDRKANTILKAFRNGFSDCVSLDQGYTGELLQAIRRAVERGRRGRLITEEIEHLSKLAKYDRLTGLPNRVFLEDRLSALIASAERRGGEFSLFMIDINNFKQINDVHGHVVGDQALRAFARKLTSAARASDTCGRFGGDEFLYLIDHVPSSDGVARVRERLADALSFPVQLDAVGLSLSASIGTALFPADGVTSDQLLTAADRAMYAAKDDAGQRAQRPAAAVVGEAVVPQTADTQRVDYRHENRRAARRNRIFKRARVILGDGYSTVECVVRDVSDNGARITIEDPIAMPGSFSFVFLDKGVVQAAVVRWQRGRNIGIEFPAAVQREGQSRRTRADATGGRTSSDASSVPKLSKRFG